jgi:hypothetical protein
MKTCKAADAPELPQRGRYTSLSLRGDGSQEHAGDFSSKPTSARAMPATGWFLVGPGIAPAKEDAPPGSPGGSGGSFVNAKGGRPAFLSSVQAS